MQNIKELTVKVHKIIDSEENIEVQKVVQEILQEYEHYYKQYIGSIYKSIEGNTKQEENIRDIAIYAKKDYTEMEQTLKTIQLAEEEYRKKELEERIMPIIEDLVRRKQDKNTKESININTSTFSDNKKREKMKEEKNSRYAKEITNNIISEMKTSKNIIINKVKSLKLNNGYDENAKTKFEKEMQQLIEKATQKLQEIEQILKSQDQKIYNQIEEQWKQYYVGNTYEAQENKQKFRERITQGVNIDEKAAMREVENNQQVIETPEDIIE